MSSEPWSQRWRDGRHSWTRTRDGGFDPVRYQVTPISEPDARRFVERHHYSHSWPAAIHRHGMIDTDSGELVGVAVLGAPTSTRVLTNVLPTLEPYTESVELSRFVLLDQVPSNAESWLLGRMFRQLRNAGVRGIVSFSDPVPRTTLAGDTVMPGHLGVIYQAANSVYTGRGTPRTITLLPDGTVLNDRSAQKVRSQHQGHAYVENRLAALGAKPITSADDPSQWLRTALTDIGARKVRHPGPHRYVFRLGSPRDQRQIPIRAAVQPYPKDGQMSGPARIRQAG